MKFSSSALILLSALGPVLAGRNLMTKSSKTGGSSSDTCTDTCPSKVEYDAVKKLTQQLGEIEKLTQQGADIKKLTDCLNDPAGLSKCTVTPSPAPPSCADAKARINQLAQSLPDGCTLAFNNEIGKYRLVCTKSNVDELILPKMCNPTFVIVGAGGSGGVSQGHHMRIGTSSLDYQAADCPPFNDTTADYLTGEITGLGGGGGAGGVRVLNHQGESTEEGAWIARVGKGRMYLSGEDTSFAPLNPAILSNGINKFDLFASGGGAGGYTKIFVEAYMLENRIDSGSKFDFACTDAKLCGLTLGMARDESAVFPAMGGGSGGGGSAGVWQRAPFMSCSVPKQGLVVRGISPQTKEPYFLPESSVSGEGSYNKQLVGGDYISGQGNKGGDGDVFLRDPKNDTYVMQRAGGGGGAGGPGENAQVDIPVPLKLGANGGIGRNLTDIVGGDLGQTGFFGGGGGAYFGNGGRGGGGRMIIFGGVGLSYKAIDGTGGGGVAGLPIEADKTVGGSGIIIVTFDACGCVGP